AQIVASFSTAGNYTRILWMTEVPTSARPIDTGSYLLTLAKGPGTFATSTGDEGGDLPNGATQAGTIYLGDLDQWSFTATQGDYKIGRASCRARGTAGVEAGVGLV